MLNLGVTFPNFDINTTIGQFKLHEYLGDSWALFCSHPADFTPVCTTEIGRMAQLTKETEKRNVKVLFLSCDNLDDHKEWIKDISQYSGCKIPFPIIVDNGEIAKTLGMYEENLDKFQTVRAVYILDPSKKIRAIICYPAAMGRNFDEILRAIDALQLTTKHDNIVTPANWKQGDKVLMKPTHIKNPDECMKLPSGKNYLQFIDQPTD